LYNLHIAVFVLTGSDLEGHGRLDNKEVTDDDDEAAIFAYLQPPFDFDQSTEDNYERGLVMPHTASPNSVDYSRASLELTLSE